jgi:hypothetical protein
MVDGKFIAKKTSDDPIIYRVSFDDGTGFLGPVSEVLPPTCRGAPRQTHAML